MKLILIIVLTKLILCFIYMLVVSALNGYKSSRLSRALIIGVHE